MLCQSALSQSAILSVLSVRATLVVFLVISALLLPMPIPDDRRMSEPPQVLYDIITTGKVIFQAEVSDTSAI